MKKTMKKRLGLLAGTAMLASGATAVQAEAPQQAAAWQAADAVSYDEQANVKGEFAFDQNIVTPADTVFNLFGTAATALCAKPGFAFQEPDEANYYINISGDLKKSSTIPLARLKEADAQTRVLKCSCAMGGAIANTQVVGIPLSRVLEMVDMEEDINTVTVKDSEGYGLPIPLRTAIENEALLVYQIGGRDITAAQGAPLQLWMPQATARYFTRGVAEIELTHEAEEPRLMSAEAGQRAKIRVLNKAEDHFTVGDQIVFEGYADDYDVAIAAVEFSLDNGKTWTSCPTSGATTDRWVYWYFGYTCDTPGTFKMNVRARTANGGVSPLESSVVFTVTQ